MTKLSAVLLLLCSTVQAAERSVAPDTIAERAQGCATCHGSQGEGTADPNFPRIAGKPAGYLLNQLKNFRDGQRSYPPMNYLLAYLHDDYLMEFALYFAAQSIDLKLTSASSVSREVKDSRLLVTSGDPKAGVPACVSCHGKALTGIEPGVPGLIGLDSRYIAAQLVSWRVGTRHANKPDCMRDVASRLSEQQVRDVAAWLGSQRTAGPLTPASAGSWTTSLPCGSQP